MQNLIYKAQLNVAGLVSHKTSIMNEERAEADKVLVFGKKIGENKGHNDNRNKTLSYLKGTLCPRWFLEEHPNADRNSTVRSGSASISRSVSKPPMDGTIATVQEDMDGNNGEENSLNSLARGTVASATSGIEKISLENITSVDAYGREVVFDVDGSEADQRSQSPGSRVGTASPFELLDNPTNK